MNYNKNENKTSYVTHVERMGANRSCHTYFEIKTENGKLLVDDADAQKIYQQLGDVMSYIRKQTFEPSIDRRQKEHKPYTYTWFRLERERLLLEENYEQAAELKQLMQLVKAHQKQKASATLGSD
jgi:predicted nucleotidyltransferase